MDTVQPFLLAIARIVFLASAGYIIFKNEFAQSHILKPLLFAVMNVFLPIFFIHSYSFSWDAAVSAGETTGAPGWILMISFCGAAFMMMFLQGLIGWLCICKLKLIKTKYPVEMILLFAINNNAFLPFAILKPIVPPVFIVYMFFYTLAFNLVAWTVVAPCVQRNSLAKKSLITAYIPLFGLLAGLFIAAFDLYKYVPSLLKSPFHIMSCATLDLILFVLGGILACIPNVNLRKYKEFNLYILFRMICFPLIMLAVALGLPLSQISSLDITSAMRITMVLEAAVPPASVLMLIVAAYGDSKQVDFVGNGIIVTYLASAVTMPIFLLIAAALIY